VERRNLLFRVHPRTSPWPHKNKVEKSGMFLAPRKGSFPTTFTTHSTTFSPSKNHVQPTAFSKTPLKNTSKTAEIPRLGQRQIFLRHLLKMKQSILRGNRLRKQLLDQRRNLMHQSLMSRRISRPRKPRMNLPHPPIPP
jgi:hypothetical protein